MGRRIPDDWLDIVVAIGAQSPGGILSWIGTGFIYEHKGSHMLVTCRHVVERHTSVRIRYTVQGEAVARDYDQPVDERAVTYHPKLDLAVFTVPTLDNPKGTGVMCLKGELTVCSQDMRGRGIGEGVDVVVIGFWPEAAGDFVNSPVVRKGIIAQARDACAGKGSHYLIDCMVAPGTSGAPVLAWAARADGRAAARMIGVVEEYKYFEERAVSERTGHWLLRIQQNTGLAQVIPADRVYEVVEKHLERFA